RKEESHRSDQNRHAGRLGNDREGYLVPVGFGVDLSGAEYEVTRRSQRPGTIIRLVLNAVDPQAHKFCEGIEAQREAMIAAVTFLGVIGAANRISDTRTPNLVGAEL